MGAPDLSVKRLIAGTAAATAANVVGRTVNVAFPLVILAQYAPDQHTDGFFLTLALSFFFSGSLANALTDATVPVVVQTHGVPTLRFRAAWAALCAAAFLVAWSLALALAPAGRPTLALGGALMVTAGVLSAFPSATLYAHHRYLAPGLLWLARLPAFLALPLLPDGSEQLGWFAVCVGLADVLRLEVLRRMARRLPPSSAESKATPMLGFGKHYLSIVLSSALAGLNPIVDRWIASLSGPGDISVLDLAERFFGIVGSLATVGFATVALVHLSTPSRGRPGTTWWQTVRITILWGVAWTTVGLVFGVVALPPLCSQWLALSPPQQAALEATYTNYTYGILPLLLGILAVRQLYSEGQARRVPPIAVVSLLLNALLSYGLFRLLGVSGIALATTLVYCVTAALLLAATRKVETGRSARRLLHTEEHAGVETQMSLPRERL